MRFITPLLTAALLLLAAPGAADERTIHELRISVDFDRTNIENVFRAFGELMRINIVLHPSIRGTVSLRLHDTPIDESFEIILRLKGLYSIREGNIMLIYPLGVLPEE